MNRYQPSANDAAVHQRMVARMEAAYGYRLAKSVQPVAGTGSHRKWRDLVGVRIVELRRRFTAKSTPRYL